MDHNLKLSENRALALGDYIRRQDRIDPELLHVAWKGEDWEGLRAALDRFPGLLKRDEVLRVIDECTGDRDACEKKLQQIEPRPSTSGCSTRYTRCCAATNTASSTTSATSTSRRPDAWWTSAPTC